MSSVLVLLAEQINKKVNEEQCQISHEVGAQLAGYFAIFSLVQSCRVVQVRLDGRLIKTD